MGLICQDIANRAQCIGRIIGWVDAADVTESRISNIIDLLALDVQEEFRC